MTDDFFASVLDSLSDHIAVIDHNGAIVWVNEAWKLFSEENGGDPDRTCRGANYLQVCGGAVTAGEPDGKAAFAGIDSLIGGTAEDFYFEYPCHSPTTSRWFMMRARRLRGSDVRHYLVSHHDITERKLAELRVEELATIDGLTGLANRRRFDEFLDDEWSRAMRLNHPLSAVLIDVDYFKRFNDTHGHLAGDACLQQVADALSAFSRRPGDLVARYGGEEFAAILGNTDLQAAMQIGERMRRAIELKGVGGTAPSSAAGVTVSVGVATASPATRQTRQQELVAAADSALYKAKDAGRNRVEMTANWASVA